MEKQQYIYYLNLPGGFAVKFDNERLHPFEDIIESQISMLNAA